MLAAECKNLYKTFSWLIHCLHHLALLLISFAILTTYEIALDDKKITFSGNMIDYHRQCFTRVRDLFVECGAVNDDYSQMDQWTSFKAESSK